MLRSLLVSAAAALLVAACTMSDPASPDSPNANANATTTATTTDASTPIPTFAGEIEALVQEKCQRCHREGGIAPFSLVTYDEVRAMGNIARQKVEAREMPPWGAFNDDACNMQHTFKDDLSLSQAQIDTFSRWVANGMPLGDPALRPAPKTDFGAATLADATDTFRLPAPYDVKPGSDDIRCFPVDPKLTTDAWVGATNVVPGDPRVVHHVIVYLDPGKEGPAKAGPDGSYKCFGGPGLSSVPSILLAWAPGVPPSNFGADTGLKIPKTAGLVLQVHYHPSNVVVKDQTAFELKRLPKPPSQVAQIILAGNARDAAGSNNGGRVKLLPGESDPTAGPAFAIPADAPAHVESMVLTVPETVSGFPLPQLKIAAVGAHMHWAGVDMKIDIERKSELPAKECLLGTPKYDFNWQRGYIFDEPLEKMPTLNGGDKVRFTCTYNNTMKNRHVAKAMSELPSAVTLPITLGETTGQEMCLGVIVGLRPFISLVDQ